jgi:VIT1/CCC1 family predicted Fe2+/Mn2+ transporter
MRTETEPTQAVTADSAAGSGGRRPQRAALGVAMLGFAVGAIVNVSSQFQGGLRVSYLAVAVLLAGAVLASLGLRRATD